MRVPSSDLRRRRSAGQRGVAVLMTAMSILVLLAAVGLAIDSSVAYALKAKLSSAADAAAIAAARSLSVGLSLSDQEASALSRADAFFRANFGHSQLITHVPTVVASVAETAERTRTVTVSVTAAAPQFFLQIFGFKPTTIRAVGKASRRDVNLIIILDRSYSMHDSMAPGNPCTTMKAASANFVKMFAEGRDRLGLITYGSSWYRGFAPGQNFKTASPSIPGQIAQISCQGSTSTAMALWEGYRMIQTINEPGSLNLIMIFTDGVPNGVTADYPVKTKTDRRYGYDADSYTRTNTEYDMLPSPCTDAENDKYDRNNGASNAQFSGPLWNPNWTPGVRTGVLSHWGTGTSTTGATIGVLKDYAPSITDSNEYVITSNQGCRFRESGGGDRNYVRRDIAYIPNADVYGNSTSGYKSVSVFGSGHAYVGYKRPDSPLAITNASINAADNAAQRIRDDDNLAPVIYAIGLGAVDHEFLRRITNDPASPIYDPNEPDGMYVYAPTPTDLNYAFNRVASEILRIAR